MDAIVAAGGTVMKAYNDVKSLLGGNIASLSAVMADVEALKADFTSIMSACGIGMIYGFDGACQDDMNAIVTTVSAIGSDIGELVKGDISVVGDIISKAQSLVGQLQQAVSDCV